jgi:hypothetical protein
MRGYRNARLIEDLVIQTKGYLTTGPGCLQWLVQEILAGRSAFRRMDPKSVDSCLPTVEDVLL